MADNQPPAQQAPQRNETEQQPPGLQQIADAMRQMMNEMQHMRGHLTRVDQQFAQVNERLNRRVRHTDLPSQNVPPANAAQVALPPTVKLPKLEKVNGKNVKALRQFLRDVEGYMAIHQIDSNSVAAVFFVSRHFEGDLAEWFASEQQRSDDPYGGFTSFTTLSEAMLNQFVGIDPQEEARDALRNAKQTSTVARFAAYMRRYTILLPNRPDEDNLHTFLRGLKDEISLELAKNPPTTFEEAVRAALRIEAHLDSRKNSKAGRTVKRMDLNVIDEDQSKTEEEEDKGSNSDSTVDAETEVYYLEKKLEQKKKKMMESKKKSSDRTSRFKKEGRCFECSEKGHLARDCPKKKSSGN
eukprot:scaffold176870_cov16-Prasinocladus_malaysianus.AAC.1